MGSPYPLSFTLRWPYYLLRPSMRRRGFFRRWPLSHAFGDAAAGSVVRLLFLGDLMPGSTPRIPTIHPDIAALCRSADLVVLSCEGVVGDATRRQGLRLHLGVDYVRAWLDALAIQPTDCVLSVANNHAGDDGPEGFAGTWTRLVDLGVSPVGSRDQPTLTVERGGLSVGISAWTVWQNRPLDLVAREPCRVAADWVAAFPHWEAEFRHFPRAATRGVARDLLGDGFHLVAGSHPHVVQPVEWWGEGICAYSLGNFSLHPLPRVRWPLRLGAALEVTIRASGPQRGRTAGYRLHPILHEVQEGEPRLVPLSGASPALRRRAERRLAILFREVIPAGAAP